MSETIEQSDGNGLAATELLSSPDDETQMAAKLVLDWAINQHARATGDYARLHAEEVGRHASMKAWDDEHPDDGAGSPFSENPFRDRYNHGRRAIELASEEMHKWESVKRFVADRLCDMIRG